MVSQAVALADAEKRLIGQWQRSVEGYSCRGQVGLWGAGAKGVTFANLVDPSADLIECVIDLNRAKQGHFLPGTGHPIIAPEDLPNRQIRYALVLNPNYVDEIRQLLEQIAPRTIVVDLSNALPWVKQAA
jgi:hypothetical protein